ncbi:MAG: glycosyltransferase family 9 protein [Verrucomicrobia bacterium]|nr:glycosyltransferase family 9 protein [Verrucomicrobiota bacterium]
MTTTDAKNFDSIIVLSLGGSGDTLLATALIRELRAHYPTATLDVLVMQGQSARDVLLDNPAIDSVMLHDFSRATPWASWCLLRRLRRRRYACTILPVPHNRMAYGVIARCIGSAVRIGFVYSVKCGSRERWWLTRLIDEDPAISIIDNNSRLITDVLGLPRKLDPQTGVFPGRDNEAWADRVMAACKLNGQRIIGLHVGSGTTKNLQLKRWAPEKWAALAQLIAADKTCRLLLLGGPEESELRRTVLEQANLPPEILMELPHGSVRDVAALVKRMSLVVCGDTLLSHLAAAVGTPVVAIFGPTSSVHAPPHGVAHRIIKTGVSCSPCYSYSRFGIRCTNADPLVCLTAIAPDYVHQQILELLSSMPASR